ncbi:MAG TPA: hypothetical protein DCP63_05095 [Bacteroidetes bacterium]|nr:hypothetical protein [Bacteroidota bacterium]
MRKDRISKLKEFLDLDPNDSFSRYALALEYAALDDSVQAAALLEELLRRDPDYVPAYQQLGYVYQRISRREDAVAVFKRGIAIATQQHDQHAAGEMREALDEILDAG